MHPRLNFRQEEISSEMEWEQMRSISVRRPVRCAVRENTFHPFWQNDSLTHTQYGNYMQFTMSINMCIYFTKWLCGTSFLFGWGIKFTEREWAMCVCGGFSHVQTHERVQIARIFKSFCSSCVVCCHATSLFKWQFFDVNVVCVRVRAHKSCSINAKCC